MLISSPMANRLLLTLLALLTGLATQITPAQARICAVQSAEVGVVIASPSARTVAVCPILARLPEPGRRQVRLAAPAGESPVAFAQRAPAVLIGVDRARE